jgi:23S rRNA (pseudouridine1915-N3)-methyltransferase
MEIRLLAVGTRLPGWVNEGYATYAKRLPRAVRLSLVEIPLGGRGARGDPARAVGREGEKMLSALHRTDCAVALTIRGQQWSTLALSRRLAGWLQGGRNLALMIGGPDGLAPACLACAELCWSLGPLTLPHGLARVVVVELLYRAWSLLNNHPYHRGHR